MSQLYFCAGPRCKGLPYKASDCPHPVSCSDIQPLADTPESGIRFEAPTLETQPRWIDHSYQQRAIVRAAALLEGLDHVRAAVARRELLVARDFAETYGRRDALEDLCTDPLVAEWAAGRLEVDR